MVSWILTSLFIRWIYRLQKDQSDVIAITNFNKLLFKFRYERLVSNIIEQFSQCIQWIERHARCAFEFEYIIMIKGKEIMYFLSLMSVHHTQYIHSSAILVNAMPFNLSLNLFKIHVISIIHVFDSFFYLLSGKMAYTTNKTSDKVGTKEKK